MYPHFFLPPLPINNVPSSEMSTYHPNRTFKCTVPRSEHQQLLRNLLEMYDDPSPDLQSQTLWVLTSHIRCALTSWSIWRDISLCGWDAIREDTTKEPLVSVMPRSQAASPEETTGTTETTLRGKIKGVVNHHWTGGRKRSHVLGQQTEIVFQNWCWLRSQSKRYPMMFIFLALSAIFYFKIKSNSQFKLIQ